MTLKFKRNLPIILTLIAILVIMAFAMGNQPLIAYTVRADSQQGATTSLDIEYPGMALGNIY